MRRARERTSQSFRLAAHVSFTILSVLTIEACGTPDSERFALRPPVLRDRDRVPFTPRPAVRHADRATEVVDIAVLRPITAALAIEVSSPAGDVNALDEVPDSSWFTNRDPSPEEVAVGACANEREPVLPFTVLERKGEGHTPGLIARDATGRLFVLKIDSFARERPETSTAADAIASRLYWAAGYNTPCNVVTYASRESFVLASGAHAPDARGLPVPFGRDDLDHLLANATSDREGRLRVSASLMIPGDALGAWRGTGLRPDDPNDVIDHASRRELRAERWLAAWLNHWDSREANTLDVFVHASDAHHGFVQHYFIDWSDALGGRTIQAGRASSLGWVPMTGIPIAGPWTRLRIDPRAPNLGYFAEAPFDPMGWRALVPAPRFTLADDDDLAWIARRLVRITPAHIRAAVASGRFSRAEVSARLADILVARREAVLRAAFARRSPLDTPRMVDPFRLCADDFAVRAGLRSDAQLSWASDWFVGPHLAPGATVPHIDFPQRGRVCASLPPARPRAPSARDDAPERYAVLEFVRTDGRSVTRMRVHLYDLGPQRGYVIAGVERR